MKVVATTKACFVSLAALSLAACSPGSEVQHAAVGGAGGAAAGAGAGALVGAVIANGDIAASAALGGIIGLPIGIAAGVLYHQYSVRNEAEERAELVRTNHQRIFERNKQLEALREQINSEAPRGLPDQSLRERNPFVGPSIGNYYR